MALALVCGRVEGFSSAAVAGLSSLLHPSRLVRGHSGCSKSLRVGAGPERRAHGALSLLSMAPFAVGDCVEVKWEGEWWPATVQEARESRCSAGEVEAVRVRFRGGTDEEWVQLKSGDIRVLRAVPDAEAYSAYGSVATTDDSVAYWQAAGSKASDFTEAQAELLVELLEYR